MGEGHLTADNSENRNCALCGKEARFSEFHFVNRQPIKMFDYDCPGCGRYLLDWTVGARLKHDKTGLAFKLACLVRERRIRHDEGLFAILSKAPAQDISKLVDRAWLVDELAADFPGPTAMIDRTLLNLSKLTQHPMGVVCLSNCDRAYLTFCDERAIQDSVSYLEAKGLIRDAGSSTTSTEITITPDGWDRIEKISEVAAESKQAFVAMWFNESTRCFFDVGIEPAVRETGFICKRIDRVEHINKICDEIVAEIRKSRFLVADFSAGCCKMCGECQHQKDCKDQVRPRGGVYFEAGFAMGLGIPVIWTIRKEQLEQVHFDIRQYNFIAYENPEDLKDRLFNRIRATIH
ncbi:MAG: hypothetical protein LLG01_01500 [Planctomycetaceae bacterium]|nr:hypothetical protein [Planctomycetaceae bacterium]